MSFRLGSQHRKPWKSMMEISGTSRRRYEILVHWMNWTTSISESYCVQERIKVTSVLFNKLYRKCCLNIGWEGKFYTLLGQFHIPSQRSFQILRKRDGRMSNAVEKSAVISVIFPVISVLCLILVSCVDV